MNFRYVVRCLALTVIAVVGAVAAAGCSSSALPAPASAGNQSSTPGTGSAAGGADRPGPSGTVTVKSGGKVVCVMTIKDGKGTCNVSLKNYKPGTLTYTGSYSGGPGYKASVSKPLNVRVSPSPKAT